VSRNFHLPTLSSITKSTSSLPATPKLLYLSESKKSSAVVHQEKPRFAPEMRNLSDHRVTILPPIITNKPILNSDTKGMPSYRKLANKSPLMLKEFNPGYASINNIPAVRKIDPHIL
jgi:hypothetical protein